MSDLTEFLECGDVVASDRGIIETEAGKQMQFVPREDIRSIVLRYGCAAHRPLVELIVGIALSVLGLADLYRIATSWKISRYDLGAVAFGAVGAYMIYTVARKYHYLHIKTASNHFNIRFARTATPDKIKSFCGQIEKRWGYNIVSTFPAS
jgi:hypothetical protein